MIVIEGASARVKTTIEETIEAIIGVGRHHLKIDIEMLNQEMITSAADLLVSLMCQASVAIRARRQDSQYIQLHNDSLANRLSLSLLRAMNLVSKLTQVISFNLKKTGIGPLLLMILS